jgi:hypothetical protein
MISHIQADKSRQGTRAFNILLRLPVLEAAVRKISDLELEALLIRLCTLEEQTQTQDKRIYVQDEHIRFLRECVRTQADELRALRQMVEPGNGGLYIPQ